MSFIFYMPPSLLFNTSVLELALPYSSVFRLSFRLNTPAFKNSILFSADAYKHGLFYRLQHFFPFTGTDKREMFLLFLFHFLWNSKFSVYWSNLSLVIYWPSYFSLIISFFSHLFSLKKVNPDQNEGKRWNLFSYTLYFQPIMSFVILRFSYPEAFSRSVHSPECTEPNVKIIRNCWYA